jgi:GNAT superfamily N-acetyltransferase
MGGILNIRLVNESDRPEWDPLWRGYNAFYEMQLASDVTDASWRRFLDPVEPLHALVADIDGHLTGFAHYLLHRSTWAADYYCYLEDLFVTPAMREHGIGQALVDAVEAAAREADASRLYWSTHETNINAQRLYDRLAKRSGYIQYRKQLG